MRRPTVAALAVLIVVLLALGYVALIGFESSLLSDRFVFIRREESATVLSEEVRGSEGVRETNSTALGRGADTATVANSERGGEGAAANATATDSHSASAVADTGSNASATEEHVSVGPADEQVQESPGPEDNDTSQLHEEDEIMTPEMIRHIEGRDREMNIHHSTGSSSGTTDGVGDSSGATREDPLAPVQVHMVWVGDTSKMPRQHEQYRERGYNLTVHSDPEEILDGFHPFVLKAYRLAIPSVVGYDFLKFALLYKHGGLSVDADTYPAVDASEVQREFPRDECDVMFGKEAVALHWEKPVFRNSGGATYGLNRPFQILNWAMAASKPRNKHIKWLLQTAMMHFFGLRDMELSLVQDISGSGLMTDYVALLHEKNGRSYREVYEDRSKFVPAEGLCLTDGYLHGKWIHHLFTNTWRQPGST